MKKFLLWILGLGMVSAIGFFIAFNYLKDNWRPLLEEQLKNAITSSSDGLYRIEYKSLDVHPINGNLKLTHFKLIPDKEAYNKLVAHKKAPDNLYHLEVDALIIRKANAKEAVQSKKLHVADIIINKPQLTIYNNRQDYNDTVSHKKENKPLHELLKDIFKELKVKQIKLNDINFTFVNKNQKEEKRTSLKNLNITINDISIDSLSAEDSSRVYYTKNVVINIKDYKIATPDSLYFVKLEDLSFSTAKNLLTLKNVKLVPRYSKNNFHKHVGYFKDRFDLDFNKIEVRGVDFNLFLNRQKLYAKLLSINNAKIDIYNNNAYRKIIQDKTGKFPHQQLLKLALDMKINEIDLKNVDINYSEFDKKSGKTGRIEFKNTRGTITNIVNDKKALNNNPVMKLKINTALFGKAPLSLNINFYMNSSIGAFDYNGSISAFDGKILNQIVKPLGMAEVNSADVQKLNFNVKANQRTARGTLKFYYTNLNVNVLKRDDDGNLKKQGLVSTLANAFVIHKQNPNNKGEFTPGNIYFVRPKEASFFSFLWKSLFTGIKESVGVSQEKENKIKNTAEDVSQAIEGVKKDIHKLKEKLQERKEHRQERREEKRMEKEKERDTTIVEK